MRGPAVFSFWDMLLWEIQWAVPLFSLCDLQSLGYATSGIFSGLADIQWVVPLFNFRDLQLRGDAASGVCNLWDVQFSFCDLQLLGCATSGIFNGWSRGIQLPRYALQGIFSGCPAAQLLRSSTAGICLWDIQWVFPLLNFCDLQFLGFSCVSVFYVIRPLLPVSVLPILLFRCLTTNPPCSPGLWGAECTVGVCL